MTELKKCLVGIVVVGALASASNAQQNDRAKGAQLLTHEEYLRLPVTPVPVSGKLPDSATLEDLFPKARQQGRLLSCTAWATSYNKAYRIFLASGRRGMPDDYLQSPGFIYSFLTSQQCNKGTAIPSAMKFLKDVGSVEWTHLPYSDSECPQWRAARQLARNKSFVGYRLPDPISDFDKTLFLIRNLIVGGDPVIGAISACAEFDHPEGGQIKSAYGPPNSCGGHAIVIVGYDDRLGAVRILNSWGEDWGEQGKIWMGYEVLRRRLLEAYVDIGPGESTAEDLALLNDAGDAVAKVLDPSPVVTAEILKAALRSNIDPKILAKYAPIEGEPVNVSIWSIWLNLPQEYASQIASVEYYFLHKTFKHNPQRPIPGSSVFLAQWRGYGCVDEAYLIARLKSGQAVRSAFNFCNVAKAEKPVK